jgi:hypothetical protein
MRLKSQQHQQEARNLQNEANITTTSTPSWKSLARGWNHNNINTKLEILAWNGMMMNTMRRRESLGSGKDQLMFRKDGLEVLRDWGCLYCLYVMELGDNTKMTFFEHLFHAMGTNDLR